RALAWDESVHGAPSSVNACTSGTEPRTSSVLPRLSGCQPILQFSTPAHELGCKADFSVPAPPLRCPTLQHDHRRDLPRSVRWPLEGGLRYPSERVGPASEASLGPSPHGSGPSERRGADRGRAAGGLVRRRLPGRPLPAVLPEGGRLVSAHRRRPAGGG